MSQAEELLKQLSETFPEHSHTVVDSDSYFIINPATRRIENTSRKELVLMQRDHNSERYTFQLPLYIEGHDMTLCNRVKCHFNNIEYDEDAYEYIEHPDMVELTDLRVNPDDRTTAICSWLITRQSTWYKGTLAFSLQFLCVDDDGNETYEWHTDEFVAVTVKKTKHNDPAAILEYTAIYEQWRERIFGAGDSVKSELIALTEQKISEIKTEGVSQVAAIANEGLRVFNTIPKDYSEISTQVDINKRFSAPVIVQEVEGDVIAVNDSAKMPVLGLQMFGKSEQKQTNGYQLFDASTMITKTEGGATVTKNSDNSFTVSGIGTITATFNHTYNLTHDETVKLIKSGKLKLKCEQRTHPYFIVRLNVQNATKLSISNLSEAESEAEVLQEWLDDETSYLRFTFYGVLDANIVSGTIKPMLYQEGDGTWEPYTGGKPSPNPDYPQDIMSVENPTVNVFGGNLLDPYKYIEDGYTTTSDGITVDILDGVAHVYGTNEKNSYAVPLTVDIPVSDRVTLPAGTYSSHPGLTVSFYNANSNPQWKNRAGRFELNEPHEIKSFYIAVDPGATVDNYVVMTLVPGSRVPSIQDHIKRETIQSMSCDVTLPGLPVSSGGNYTDENGQQYIANYRDWERGVDVNLIHELIVNGEYDIRKNTTDANNYLYYMYIIKDRCSRNVDVCLCDILRNRNLSEINDGACGVRIVGKSAILYINVKDYVSENSVEAVKAFFNEKPLTIKYALEEPIETPIPEAELQAYRAIHTNYPNTTVLNDFGAYMKLDYATDTKTYIDNKIKELVTNS